MTTELEQDEQRREQIAELLRQEFQNGLKAQIEAIIEREREEWEEHRYEQLETKLTEEFEDELDYYVTVEMEKQEQSKDEAT